MKIRIKEKGNDKSINITVPMWIATTCIKHAGSITKIKSKKMNSNTKEIINSIDFRLIAKNFKDLKKYNGLRIVDVREKNGDEVIIEI